MANQRTPEPISGQNTEVVELNDRDSGFALLDHFGIADFAETQPAELRLAPLEPEPKTFAEECKRARWHTGHSRYDDLMFGTADGQVRS